MEIIIAILLLCLVLSMPNGADVLIGLSGLAVMIALAGAVLAGIVFFIAALAS